MSSGSMHFKSSLVPHPQLKLENMFSNLNSIVSAVELKLFFFYYCFHRVHWTLNLHFELGIT